MKTKRLVFSECEHDGDLEVYKSDLRECGVIIKEATIDSEAEECDIIIEYEDWETFDAKFSQTESYQFWYL